MNSTFLKLAPGIVWAATAISSASSVDAMALTPNGYDGYANCSQDYDYSGWESPYCTDATEIFSYVQNIRTMGQGCNSGNCSEAGSGVFVDSIYGIGRKIATQVAGCHAGWSLWGLDTCAC
jgi:hypothetical protein